MDFVIKNQQQYQQATEKVNNLTNFENENNAYNTFVPHKYERNESAEAERAMNLAEYDNKVIGWALENSSTFHLDAVKKSKLDYMKGGKVVTGTRSLKEKKERSKTKAK